MKPTIALLVAASLVAMIVAGCTSKPQQTAAEQSNSVPMTTDTEGVGQPVGDFTLTDVAGKPLAKADYAGKVLVVDFWATWCTTCTAKLVKYQPLWDKYRSQGVEFIVVSSDDAAATVKGWLKTKHPELKMPFVMKSDVTTKAFWGGKSAYSIPEAKIYDRHGVLRYRLGPSSKFEELEPAIQTLLAEK